MLGGQGCKMVLRTTFLYCKLCLLINHLWSRQHLQVSWLQHMSIQITGIRIHFKEPQPHYVGKTAVTGSHWLLMYQS
jgi:hypothetical protein